jgi:hypothetical protein
MLFLNMVVGSLPAQGDAKPNAQSHVPMRIHERQVLRLGAQMKYFSEVELTANFLKRVDPKRSIAKTAAPVDTNVQLASPGLRQQHEEIKKIRLPAAVRSNEDGKARHFQLDILKASEAFNLDVVEHSGEP